MPMPGFDASMLVKAVLDKDLARVRARIDSGEDVNEVDSQGRTPLWWAAEMGQSDIVDTLIQAGADVDAADYLGWTALIAAAGKDHANIVRMLL